MNTGRKFIKIAGATAASATIPGLPQDKRLCPTLRRLN